MDLLSQRHQLLAPRHGEQGKENETPIPPEIVSFQRDMMKSLFSLSVEVSVRCVGVIGIHLQRGEICSLQHVGKVFPGD